MRTTQDILSIDYTCVTDSKTLNNAYEGCYATDLLSAAIRSAQNQAVLITLISHENTVALALMLELPAVIITEDRVITEKMIEKCNQENICLLKTSLKTHEVVIDLYRRGLL